MENEFIKLRKLTYRDLLKDWNKYNNLEFYDLSSYAIFLFSVYLLFTSTLHLSWKLLYNLGRSLFYLAKLFGKLFMFVGKTVSEKASEIKHTKKKVKK